MHVVPASLVSLVLLAPAVDGWLGIYLDNDRSEAVVVEVILEKVTNIAMGTEIDNIIEFEEIDCRHPGGREGLEMAGLLE